MKDDLLLLYLSPDGFDLLDVGAIQGVGHPEDRSQNGGPLTVGFGELHEVRMVLPRNILPVVAGDIRYNEHLRWGESWEFGVGQEIEGVFVVTLESEKCPDLMKDGSRQEEGSVNRLQAMEFLKFSTATEQLAAQASYISYGPARKSSAPLVGKYHNKDIDMGPQMPTNPTNLKNAVQNNFEFWADNADQLNERFSAWLASN